MGMILPWRQKLMARLRAIVTQFMFGAARSWVMAPHTARFRAELERLLAMMIGWDAVGLPFAPPRDKLRLLPFLVPQILYWRRRLVLWDENLEGLDLKHIGH